MALRLILHTFRMIFGNFGQALKVSVGPFLILVLAQGVLFGVIATNADTVVGANGPMVLAMLLMIPLFLFVMAWVAVAWHRFILKEEYTNILPAVSGRPIWPYAGKVILLTLLIFVISIPIFFVLNSVAIPFVSMSHIDPITGEADLPIWPLVVFMFGFLLIGFVALRLGIALVGTAVEKPMAFGEAWNVTKPVAWTIFGVVIILGLINLVPTILTFVVGIRVPILSAVFSIALNWLTTMLGISILTTIYGHVVEGRELTS